MSIYQHALIIRNNIYQEIDEVVQDHDFRTIAEADGIMLAVAKSGDYLNDKMAAIDQKAYYLFSIDKDTFSYTTSGELSSTAVQVVLSLRLGFAVAVNNKDKINGDREIAKIMDKWRGKNEFALKTYFYLGSKTPFYGGTLQLETVLQQYGKDKKQEEQKLYQYVVGMHEIFKRCKELGVDIVCSTYNNGDIWKSLRVIGEGDLHKNVETEGYWYAANMIERDILFTTRFAGCRLIMNCSILRVVDDN